jgi:hypothetical protein
VFEAAQKHGEHILYEIKKEKEERESTQASVLELLKETVGRVKSELDIERQERNLSQETILNLLEKQCTV